MIYDNANSDLTSNLQLSARPSDSEDDSANQTAVWIVPNLDLSGL